MANLAQQFATQEGTGSMPKEDKITINNIPFVIEQTKGKSWRLQKPLVDGKKMIAGSTHIAVKPSDDTRESFKSKGIDIGKPTNDGKALENLVNAIVDLKAGTSELSPVDKSGKKIGLRNKDIADEAFFKNPDSVRKYMVLAEWANLWNLEKDQAVEKKTTVRPTTLDTAKFSGKRKESGFDDHPMIKTWLKEFYRNDKEGYKRDLYSVLRLLNFSPEQLALKNYKGDPSTKEAELKKRIFPLRYWSENPSGINPATKVKRVLKMENRFRPKSKQILVDPDDITTIKWDKNPPLEKNGKRKVGTINNATMYKFAKVIKNFVNAQKFEGLAIGDQPLESILSQEAPSVALHGKLKLTWQQIEKMQTCLLEGRKNKTNVITLKRKGKTFTPKGEYTLVKKSRQSGRYSIESYWDDAYFFFMLALEMGMRAEEGFDIIAEPPINEDSSGVTIEQDGKQKIYKVFLYTRKTELMDDGKIHEGWIPNSPDGFKVQKLIDDRLAQINRGVDIQKYLDPKKEIENPIHSLIGADNKYTEISTIALPTDEVKINTETRKIIRNIMRHCYEQVDAKDVFYFDKPLHALRHVFAQYWLHKSGWNYNFVAKLGHWHTMGVLQKSYGKMGNDVFQEDHEIFASMDPSKSYREMAKAIAEARKAVPVEVKAPAKKKMKKIEKSNPDPTDIKPPTTYEDTNLPETSPDAPIAEAK